jgi:hypothetical protein
MGAYDNALLANAYQRIFEDTFAAGRDGESLGASFTVPALRKALGQVDDEGKRSRLAEYFERSNRAILRLTAMEGVEYDFPDVLPFGWPQLSMQ